MRFRKRININTESYNWFYDQKIKGTIIVFVSILMLIFSFLKVVFLSSIDGYTFGMLLGFYSPFVYIYFLYVGLELIFGDKFKKPSWIKFNKKNYWLLILIIVFLSSSMGFYQSKGGFVIIGAEPWKNFQDWFDTFTNKGISDSSSWFPGKTNGGLLGVFLYSLVATVVSGIGAIIVGVILLTIFISIILTGSSLEFHRMILLKKKFNIPTRFQRKKQDKKNQLEKENQVIFNKEKNLIKTYENIKTKDESLENQNKENDPKDKTKKESKSLVDEKPSNQEKETNDKEKDNLPFDDPFNI